MSWLTQEMSELAGTFAVVVRNVTVPAGTTGVVVAQANPLRWGLWVSYAGQVVALANLRPEGTPGALTGWQLTSGGLLDLHYRTHPALCCAEWLADNVQAQACTLLVIEEVAVQAGQ